MAVVVEIHVADDPDDWRVAGFAVGDDGALRVGRTAVRLTGRVGEGGTRGITGWSLAGIGPPPDGSLDGLATDVAEFPDDTEAPADAPAGAAPAHPNGCLKVDHVVVITPDVDRTTAALAAVGIEARRTRQAGTGPDGEARLQRFFRLGEVILELVGPAEPTADGPARFWGLAYEVADLDATASALGGLLSRPREAVQAGRRIAALRPGGGVSVPTAFLTPEPRRSTR